MSLKLKMSQPSVSADVLFIQDICKICKVLGIVPLHSFKKSLRLRLWPSKLYAVIFLSFIILGTAYSIYQRSHAVYKAVYLVLDYTNEFLLVMVILSTVLSANFYHQNTWMDLRRKFVLIDNKLLHHKRAGVVAQIRAHFFLFNFLFFTHFVYLFSMWGAVRSVWLLFKEYLFHYFCYYYEFMTKFLIYAMTVLLKHRYRVLNCAIRTSLAPKSISVIKMGCCHPRRFEALISTLADAVEDFNRLFKWPLLFVIARTVVQLLVNLNSTVLINWDKTIKVGSIIVPEVYHALQVLVSSSLILMFCHAVEAESKRTLYLCYRLQENFADESEERLELRRLAKYAAHHLPKFTAAGFFGVDRSVLFSILGTATTYFIVVMQFSSDPA